jgi:hypothetical protein
MFKNYFSKIVSGVLLMAMVSACQKDGTFMPDTEVFFFQASMVSVSPQTRYAISVNDQLLSDSLSNGNGLAKRTLPMRKDKQRVMLSSPDRKKVIVDTLISLPGNQVSIVVLKLNANANAKPLIKVSGEKSEIDPKKEKLLSFYYENPKFPDSLTLEVFSVKIDEVTFEITVDTLTILKGLKRNTLSTEKIVNKFKDPSTLFVFQLRDARTGKFLRGANFDFTSLTGPTIAHTPAWEESPYVHVIHDITVSGWGTEYPNFTSSMMAAY